MIVTTRGPMLGALTPDRYGASWMRDAKPDNADHLRLQRRAARMSERPTRITGKPPSNFPQVPCGVDLRRLLAWWRTAYEADASYEGDIVAALVARQRANAEAAALERLLTETPTCEPISKTVWSSYFPS